MFGAGGTARAGVPNLFGLGERPNKLGGVGGSVGVYELLHSWALWGGRGRTAGRARGRVLELGVGGGANLPHYGQPRCMVGVDPSPEALCHAREQAGALRFPVALVRARAEALPFAAQQFDTVVGTLVFCSVADPATALVEVRRVLAPAGELRLVEHILPARGALRFLVGLIAPLWFRFSRECRLDRETPQTVLAAGRSLRELRDHAGGVVVELVAERSEG